MLSMLKMMPKPRRIKSRGKVAAVKISKATKTNLAVEKEEDQQIIRIKKSPTIVMDQNQTKLTMTRA